MCVLIILSLLRVYTALHSLGTLSVSLQQSPLISSDYVILICAEHDARGKWAGKKNSLGPVRIGEDPGNEV